MIEVREKKSGILYPFNAIVGQEDAKTVLILNAIDPSIGGALISGPKGTGKSLLVNAFSDVIPEIEYISGCIFRCNPMDPTNMCPACRKKASEREIQTSKEKMRIIQVPLSVTEDMLVGSLDMEKAVVEGTKALEPGLLAQANQNILYIDEVNLLPDHITDSILDAAASGWNTVEREGISVSHPARFILVGTMNPEEGELRPQILDRFGIFAETTSIQNPQTRGLIVDRNEKYQKNPHEFKKSFEEELESLKNKIEQARQQIIKVEVPPELYPLVAETCSKLRVDGFRPDIITIKSARAFAAFKGRDQVKKQEIQEALEYTLGHRTRESGLTPPPLKKDIHKALRLSELRQKIDVKLKTSKLSRMIIVPLELFEKIMRKALIAMALKAVAMGVLAIGIYNILEWARFNFIGNSPSTLGFLLELILSIGLVLALDRLLNRVQKDKEQLNLGVFFSELDINVSGRLRERTSSQKFGGGEGLQAKVSYLGEDTSELNFGPKIMGSLGSLYKRMEIISKRSSTRKKNGASTGGRRTRVISRSTRGRYAWYQIPRDRPKDIAIVPTIKVAATKQVERGREEHTIIKPEDIREKVREYSAPYSIVLLVDMSLSMTESVTNIVQSIYDFHSEVYRRRDRVGLIVFKGSKAYTLQHPTRNLDLVVKKLREVGASDFTPLPAGLFQAWKTLKQEKLRNRDSILHLYVISDGIANVPLDKPLSPITRRRYSNETQADTFDVVRLLVKEGIMVHWINTNHSYSEVSQIIEEDVRISLTPTQFLKELAKVYNGEYIGLTQT